ncbi:MAG: type IX secretion system outer membrane channel protein PorV [Flavobacterium sp.]|nr:type IX secretion system outer membrane channel protein PorV [Flavobacterium sp.]
MRKISTLLFCVLIHQISFAQENVITTAVPFLLVSGDARSAGMGDNGVATTSDAFSQQYNPAKYAFSQDKQGFSASYTPYLTQLVNDISLGQVTYFNKYNERSAVGASLRYFSLGEIQLTNMNGEDQGIIKPSEMALDISYSLKLSDRFAMAVAGRFISSNLRFQDSNQDSGGATSYAVDVAAFYQSEEMAFADFNGRLRFGMNMQNLGPKINYDLAKTDENSNFLPSNLKIGSGFDFILDDFNKVSLNVEFAKLLVPTPNPDPTKSATENAAEYNKIGWSEGLFKSFNDAPGGNSEEFKEITYAVGSEYTYQDSFAFRLGYFHESPAKGARKFYTLGAGFKYNVVKIDMSYLFSASKVNNPLENTLRFSLTFNFGDKYDDL